MEFQLCWKTKCGRGAVEMVLDTLFNMYEPSWRIMPDYTHKYQSRRSDESLTAGYGRLHNCMSYVNSTNRNVVADICVKRSFPGL